MTKMDKNFFTDQEWRSNAKIECYIFGDNNQVRWTYIGCLSYFPFETHKYYSIKYYKRKGDTIILWIYPSSQLYPAGMPISKVGSVQDYLDNKKVYIQYLNDTADFPHYRRDADAKEYEIVGSQIETSYSKFMKMCANYLVVEWKWTIDYIKVTLINIK